MSPFDFLRPIPLSWTSTLLLTATAIASVPVGSLLESKQDQQPVQIKVDRSQPSPPSPIRKFPEKFAIHVDCNFF